MKVFITGGAGYVGSDLVPLLLSLDYKVTVYDLMIYGNDVLENHKNLKVIKGDIRDLKKIDNCIKNHDALIHLACISNDPSFELDLDLGKSINLDCFEPLVKISKDNGITRFVYASSSSVYGIKSENKVTENMSLEPLTDYSKFKAICEDILLRYKSEDFCVTTIRPATVCGYAKRQRLDVIINILTNHAINTGKIKIFGGGQKRPNINIKDMSRSYVHVLKSDKRMINGEIFNVGDENYTVNELGETVKNVIGDNIISEIINTNDNRSYHIDSNKIKSNLNFKLEHSIKSAVKDLKIAFENNLLPNSMNDSKYYNIKRMQELNLKWTQFLKFLM